MRKQAEWIHGHLDDMRRLNRGIAFVVRSTLIRGLVRAVMHFEPIPVPHDSFATVEEAMAWTANLAKREHGLRAAGRDPSVTSTLASRCLRRVDRVSGSALARLLRTCDLLFKTSPGVLWGR